MKKALAGLLISLLMILIAQAEDDKKGPRLYSEPYVLSRYGEGSGVVDGAEGFHILDQDNTKDQVNTVGVALTQKGLFQKAEFSCRLRVIEGGEGGSFAFLNTTEYGACGPSPFLPKMEAPNLKNSFAVGIDVSDPPNEDWFYGPGNIFGHPEREVSLHWDGREIVKRRAEKEFRGQEFNDWLVSVEYLVGGAQVSVQINDYKIYDRYFIPGMQPYEFRLGLGARTSERVTEFDVKDVKLNFSNKVSPNPSPVNFNIFNYVQTTQSEGSFTSEVDLPPENWAFGRVIMKIRIHGGSRWDEWDRCASVGVKTDDGTVFKIVRFITSYKTPCYWEVDVTDFRSMLAGKTCFVISAGTIYKDKGFLMSVDLDFYPGRPELYAFKAIPLWNGTVKYRSDDDPFGGFYEDKTVTLDERTVGAKLHLVHTGHSQVGEFTPAARTLEFNGKVFENLLWRDDCYLNPNRPQFGTWKFPRAGWAPGDVCHPWLIDVSDLAEPGAQAVIRYLPQKYEFTEELLDGEEKPGPDAVAAANHIVSSYLILYEEPADLIDAPTVMILNVSSDSAAHKAGLKAGDYLFSYDGQRLFSRDDVDQAKKQATAAGKNSVELIVYRGSETLKIDFPTGTMGISLGSR